jgi:hypothetical protein
MTLPAAACFCALQSMEHQDRDVVASLLVAHEGLHDGGAHRLRWPGLDCLAQPVEAFVQWELTALDQAVGTHTQQPARR